MLTKDFDGFIAVDGINLSVDPGEVLVLLGPNGAGKTTTVRMLTSILVPSAGRAWVAGYDVVQEAHQVRRTVGVLTEHHGLYGRMKAREYLDFFSDLYGLPRAEGRGWYGELLERFGLSPAVNKRLGEYSKGMRQKLALVRALIHKPRVLLLDEPTSAMDPESAWIVRDSIRKMQSSERSILICTHNLAEAEILADKIAIIRKGRIIACDTIEVIKEQFLGPRQFEVTLSNEFSLDGFTFPQGVKVIDRFDSRFRFEITNHRENNPRLVDALVKAGAHVVTLQEIERPLENAYLEAMNRFADD